MVGHPALPSLHFFLLFSRPLFFSLSRRRLSLSLFIAMILRSSFFFCSTTLAISFHELFCYNFHALLALHVTKQIFSRSLSLSFTLPIPPTLVADYVVGRKRSGLRTGSYCSHKFIQTIRSYNILLHELINCFFPGLLIFHIVVIYFRSNKIYDRRHLACSSSLHRTRIRWCVVSP